MGTGVHLLKVAFDAWLPISRWATMFHVLCLEHPGLQLEWLANGSPPGTLLHPAHAGLFVHPPERDGLRSLTLDLSPMFVALAAGHRLAGHDELRVADVLHEPFPGTPAIDATWSAFWTLDAQRGAPALRTEDEVDDIDGLAAVVGSGRAIATIPAWLADGLPHAGVLSVPLRDGPPVETRLVWRTADEHPMVAALVDLALAWTSRRT